MPTTRLEEWRYTDLRRKLELDGLAPAGVGAGTFRSRRGPARLLEAMEADRDASGHLVEMDGAVVPRGPPTSWPRRGWS
jgi:hypothetical protein